VSTTSISVSPDTVQQWGTLLELAAREVFQMMVGGELQPDPSDGVPKDITAMIGLAGQLCGLVTIQCSSECAGQIASAMLGTDVTGVDDGALDALGEICNMIAGNFKAKISGLADGCVLSVPTVIRGSDYELHAVGEGMSVTTDQSYNSRPLHIALSVHQ
jgi:chemotaxis protein CheX